MNHFKLPLAAACLVFTLSATPILAAPPVATPRPAPTLSPGRMRACEARQDAVKNRLNSLINMASNMLDVFSNIAGRVENYYTTVVVPSGKTVSNYDALVSDIGAKKTAVTDAWTKAQTDANAFACASGDPRQLLLQFRLDMIATKTALKDYRTAIRNLIVAVHRVAPEASVSPKPSASPETKQ